jgi:tRNA dimethylallyltransferase
MTLSPETGSNPPSVVVVTGPTASGKTELAIRLAERFDGEVINADSMQVYRFMNIGTAKPTLEERARVPHHLFDVVTPDLGYSAGRFAEEARGVVQEIDGRGRLPILAGGTGLYIRAALHGLIATGAAAPELRARLEAEAETARAAGDPELLHARLSKLDPKAAGAIHPHDSRRTIRALEIIEQSGQLASAVREDHRFGEHSFRSLHLAIDPGRDTVSQRIESRCQGMIDAGLLREVRDLRARGYGPELRSMRAIGYRHINPVADGVDTLANALVAMSADTRRFARRQRTWLRKVESAIWLDPSEEDVIFRRVERFCRDAG